MDSRSTCSDVDGHHLTRHMFPCKTTPQNQTKLSPNLLRFAFIWDGFTGRTKDSLANKAWIPYRRNAEIHPHLHNGAIQSHLWRKPFALHCKNSPSLPAISLLWKVFFVSSLLFFCLPWTYHELLLITSFLFSPVSLSPVTTDNHPMQHLELCDRVLSRPGGFVFFFSTLYSCYLPGRTMQKLIISMPWCSNFLSSVGWIIELCLFYYWEVHESPCDWYPLSITILGQNIAAELSGKGEITLRQRWGHSASLSAGFAAKSALKKDRKRQWKISKFCRGKS